jgi:CelD/BcsL family acetyltransferase involved in cellulose biosynthesis
MLKTREVALPVRVEIVEDVGRFAALRDEWDALLSASDAGIFNAWSWLFPWYRRIGHQRGLFLLLAREDGGRLVGLMPLCLETLRVLGRPVRRLSFLGETHVGSDYLDVVAVRGREQELAELFAVELAKLRGRWDVLDLNDLDEKSPTLEVFSRVFDAALCRRTERFVCPYEPLTPGQDFDSFLRGTARRDNFLRRKKWLQKQDGYTLELAERPGQLAAPLAEFFRLHRLRWAEDGGSQGIKGSGVEAFHRDATGYLAEDGRLRLFSLKVAGTTIASVYGIVHAGKFIYFQSGYDPAWANKSVGLVLVGETFRCAHEERLSEYDFLRGTESYKSDWTHHTRKTVALRIFDPQGAGAWFERAENVARMVRNGIKSLLPVGAVELVRRLRRRRAALE